MPTSYCCVDVEPTMKEQRIIPLSATYQPAHGLQDVPSSGALTRVRGIVREKYNIRRTIVVVIYACRIYTASNDMTIEHPRTDQKFANTFRIVYTPTKFTALAEIIHTHL